MMRAMTTEKPANSPALYYVIEDPDDDDGDSLIVVGSRDGEELFRESVGAVSQTQAQATARQLLKTRGIDLADAVWIEDPENDPRLRDSREASRDIDLGLTDPKRLMQRKIAGEHICVFCAHDVVCEIANATRRNASLCVVIAGCAAFDHAG